MHIFYCAFCSYRLRAENFSNTNHFISRAPPVPGNFPWPSRDRPAHASPIWNQNPLPVPRAAPPVQYTRNLLSMLYVLNFSNLAHFTSYNFGFHHKLIYPYFPIQTEKRDLVAKWKVAARRLHKIFNSIAALFSVNCNMFHKKAKKSFEKGQSQIRAPAGVAEKCALGN